MGISAELSVTTERATITPEPIRPRNKNAEITVTVYELDNNAGALIIIQNNKEKDVYVDNTWQDAVHTVANRYNP